MRYDRPALLRRRLVGKLDLEEVLQLGEQDVLDRGQLVAAPGPLIDQAGTVADQHPQRVGIPGWTLEEAALEAEALPFEQQTCDQPGVQRVGLGLLADHQVATAVQREVLEPVNAIAVSLQPGGDGAPVPSAGGLHPDPDLVGSEAQLAEPTGQAAEA